MGVSATHLDVTMVPYYRKSFYKHYKEICDIIPFVNSNLLDNVDENEIGDISINDSVYKGKSVFNFIKRYIWKKAFELTNKETKQAVEGMYHNANTLMSRSGNQLPFTSINYGTSTCIEGREIIKAILKGSIKGIGKYHRTPIFPCGIFQLKKGINVKKGDPNYDLKKLAIKSTIKRLYPNYANCDWTVQQSWHEEDIELKENVVNKLDKDFKQELIKFLKKNPQFKEKLSLKIENNDLVVDKNEAPTSIFGTMGCVDGQEVITYKVNGQLRVNSFEKMWNEIDHIMSYDHASGNSEDPNLYFDFEKEPKLNVKIYDSGKKDFVKVKKLIRNVSTDWNKVYLTDGNISRALDCTTDHPLPTNRGRIFAKDLKIGDTIKIVTSQYTENVPSRYDNDLIWFYGLLLYNGIVDKEQQKISLHIPTDFVKVIERFESVFNKFFSTSLKLIRKDKLSINLINFIICRDNKRKCDKLMEDLITLFTNKKQHIFNDIFTSDTKTRLSFLAGMCDNSSNIYGTSNSMSLHIYNKELALRTMALIQSLNMKVSFRESEPVQNEILHVITFSPTTNLIDTFINDKYSSYITEDKRDDKDIVLNVVKVVPYQTEKYSYDVTTESDHFDVSGIWSHNCRTANGSDVNFTEEYYLNQLKDVVSGKIKERDLDVDIRAKDQKDGRGNICPCTIILPTIAMQSLSKLDKNATNEQKIKQFLEDLDVKIHQAKDGLIERYNHIISQDKRAATFVWENGTMAGYKGDIESYMKHGTLAIGQLGLAETLQILIGKNQLDSEGMKVAKEIESLYNTRCKEFKKEYKLNFGVYYTPKRLWVA